MPFVYGLWKKPPNIWMQSIAVYVCCVLGFFRWAPSAPLRFGPQTQGWCLTPLTSRGGAGRSGAQPQDFLLGKNKNLGESWEIAWTHLGATFAPRQFEVAPRRRSKAQKWGRRGLSMIIVIDSVSLKYVLRGGQMKAPFRSLMPGNVGSWDCRRKLEGTGLFVSYPEEAACLAWGAIFPFLRETTQIRSKSIKNAKADGFALITFVVSVACLKNMQYSFLYFFSLKFLSPRIQQHSFLALL